MLEEAVHLSGPQRVQRGPQLLQGLHASLDEHDLELTHTFPCLLYGLPSGGIVGIVERHDPAEVGSHLLQELETLHREVGDLGV